MLVKGGPGIESGTTHLLMCLSSGALTSLVDSVGVVYGKQWAASIAIKAYHPSFKLI